MIENKRQASSVSRLFSASVIQSIANNSSPKLFKELPSLGLTDYTLSEYFDTAYKNIFTCYKNEYIYKNSIIKKILLGRHSINTAHMLSEFRVGLCKADLVLLNGTSHAYEIKTEFDTLERLDSQIDAYIRVFDKVTIVTAPYHLDSIISKYDNAIGILILNDDGSHSTIRKAQSNKSTIKSKSIFGCLRKKEYMSIIKNVYGKTPMLPNTLMHKKCEELFSKIDAVTAHDQMVNALKSRGCSKKLSDYVEKLPESLKAIGFTMNMSDLQKEHLLSRLGSKL